MTRAEVAAQILAAVYNRVDRDGELSEWDRLQAMKEIQAILRKVEREAKKARQP